ncbi:MAG TPA: WG repeat-containing protein [Pyrinomonadaceae bacterium]|nr:WG repeat-containing protein [Pyrinomonadaceae bacterium]
MFKRSFAFLACLLLLCACLAAARAQEKTPGPLFPVRLGGKWGYIDRTGKIVIRPQYDGAFPFYDGVARVMTGQRFAGARWSYIDKSGKPIFKDLPVDRLEDFTEGLGAVCLDKRDERGGILCGYMDTQGKWAIAPEIYNVMEFRDGLARVALPSKESRTWTREVYLDKTGKVALDLSSIPTQNSNGFSEGLARFAVSGKGEGYLPQGFMDKTGKVVIEPKFEGAGDFSEGLAAVMFFKPPKVPDYEKDEPFDAGFIDRTGKIVIKPQFEYYQPFSEGLAFVLIRGKMGAIDKTGQVRIRPQFDLHEPRYGPYSGVLDYFKEWRPWMFSEGLAAVSRGNLWGYVDKTGKLVIPPRFRKAFNFSNGLALVIVGNRVGYIDRRGRYVWRPTR